MCPLPYLPQLASTWWALPLRCCLATWRTAATAATCSSWQCYWVSLAGGGWGDCLPPGTPLGAVGPVGQACRHPPSRCPRPDTMALCGGALAPLGRASPHACCLLTPHALPACSPACSPARTYVAAVGEGPCMLACSGWRCLRSEPPHPTHCCRRGPLHPHLLGDGLLAAAGAAPADGHQPGRWADCLPACHLSACRDDGGGGDTASLHAAAW